MTTPQSSDVLIIGGGAAGLSLALRVADKARVTILAKAALTESASLYAQGGVAAVLNGQEDTFDSHIQDTLNAGAGLCRRDTVEFVVRQGPEAIRWLIDRGVPFSQEKQANGAMEYHLTREGAQAAEELGELHNFKDCLCLRRGVRHLRPGLSALLPGPASMRRFP